MQSFLQVTLSTATKALLLGRKVEEEKLFLKDSVKVLKALVLKLQERSPLQSLVVRYCSALSPRNMVEHPKECPVKYNKLVDVRFKHNWLRYMEEDRCKCQFEDLFKSVCTLNSRKFWENKVSVTLFWRVNWKRHQIQWLAESMPVIFCLIAWAKSNWTWVQHP